MSFTQLKTTYIDSLNVTLEEYVHNETKAKHFHIASDDTNNTFLVGFLTVPQDSTGVAHILEHTALCGSKNYPVRDPFFMMIRRSLNTFMNAFTSSDWTAYPFSSQNKKDFYNLMNIYLDAAFFPNLNYYDFLQEGHRFEFEEPENPKSPLIYKGVVFNEMKGAMSSPISLLYQEITTNLFPTVTYHHNSGGDPKNIPDLTHEALKAFHAKHYHPSNSVIFTYGNLDPKEHQKVFEERVLSQFTAEKFDFAVPDEQRFDAPKNVVSYYPLPKEESLEKKTHVIDTWLLGPIYDNYDVMRARILSGVLLDNSSSPLRLALESSDLGIAPSTFCGLEDSTKEIFFCAGLEGTDGNTEAVDELIMSTLRKVRDENVDISVVESVLHQLELSSREITEGRMPYGLNMILQCLAPVLHGGEAVDALAIDNVLLKMREEIQNPNFIPELIDRMLINNPHKLCLTVRPSHTMADEIVADEKARLAKIQSELTEQAQKKIIDEAMELKRRQGQIDDISCLPMVTREDIPKKLAIPEVVASKIDDQTIYAGAVNTNGMIYQSLIVELPKLTAEESRLLPYLNSILTDVGCGSLSYTEQQARIYAVTGGLSATTLYQADHKNGQLKALWVLSGKALANNSHHLSDVLKETFFSARFDEIKRIQELLNQIKLSREEGIVSNGHLFAMGAASQNTSELNYLSEEIGGMKGIQQGNILTERLKDNSECEVFAEKLKALLHKLNGARYELMSISSADELPDYSSYLAKTLAHNTVENETYQFPFTVPNEPLNIGWAINAPVHYCGKSYKVVTADHEDAPALTILAGFLRNGYLHRAIREQGGAYGGGANYNGKGGAFNFFSYRDPRLTETLADFNAAIDWMLSTEHEQLALEEAVLGVISSIDKPASPAAEYQATAFANYFGNTPEMRETFRANVLKVTLDDLKNITRKYFVDKSADIAVLGPKDALEKANLKVYTFA
ncbi:insulinase family protein [Wohlfahrtiimonas larvae]|uniref:Insulinase family protein n=1 Tax=Wohlfahrtiimonas larvae TaxID=1157986 RepID=A0ABP9MYU8_9GAMM|nr:insulinase family protein [Wohlfahrtiimonas larvae]